MMLPPCDAADVDYFSMARSFAAITPCQRYDAAY